MYKLLLESDWKEIRKKDQTNQIIFNRYTVKFDYLLFMNPLNKTYLHLAPSRFKKCNIHMKEFYRLSLGRKFGQNQIKLND